MIYTACVPRFDYPKLSMPRRSRVGTTAFCKAKRQRQTKIGASKSQYDILDAAQTVVDSNISVPNPAPVDNSTPATGRSVLRRFIGGSSQMSVWSVPIFLTVSPSLLAGAGFNGNMTLERSRAAFQGTNCKSQTALCSVYSNINVDTFATGSLSSPGSFWRARSSTRHQTIPLESLRVFDL